MERLEIKAREEEEEKRRLEMDGTDYTQQQDGTDYTQQQDGTSSLTRMTSVESHPLDPTNIVRSPTPSKASRDHLRLNDLKVVYPEGKHVQSHLKVEVEETQTKPELDESLMKKEVSSVAVDWESLRSSKECPCGFAFDQTTVRNHCYSCGRLHCLRCIDRKIILPGHVICVGDEAEVESSSGSSDVFESPGHVMKKKKEEGIDMQNMRVPVCRTCYKMILEKDSYNLSSS